MLNVCPVAYMRLTKIKYWFQQPTHFVCKPPIESLIIPAGQASQTELPEDIHFKIELEFSLKLSFSPPVGEFFTHLLHRAEILIEGLLQANDIYWIRKI